MDPISGLILCGLMVMYLGKTASSTVTDVMAQKRGDTPPSLEKWRARNKARQQRGGRPRSEPSPMRRRWQNVVDQHAERASERAAQKHQGRMAHLRETRPDKVEAERGRYERREQRRQAAREKAARVGGATVDGMRQAVSGEARRERAAWNENTRRDQEAGQDRTGTGLHHDGEPELTEHQRELVARMKSPESARFSDEEWFALPVSARADVLMHAQRHGKPTYINGSAAVEADPELKRYLAQYCNPYDIDGGIRQAEMNRDEQLNDEFREWAERVDQPRDGHPDRADAQAQAAFGATAAPAATSDGTDPDVPNPRTDHEQEGTTTMNTPLPSGEITNLSEAEQYVTAASDYCGTIAGTFEDTKAQASATMMDLQQQAATLENAQSELAGRGFSGEVTGHFASVEEHFSTLTANMAQVETLLASTEEALAAAQAEMDSAGQVFAAQRGIADEVQAHRDVATDTAFYQHA